MVKLHTALLVVCVVAVLAGGVLSVVLVAASAPERCCGGPVADPGALPSPTVTPPGTRAPGPAHCLIGSWRTVDEGTNLKFYTDADPFPFTFSGRYYEFHPDGTAIERNDNVVWVGHYRGNEQRMVANGWRTFTWTATGDTINYVSITGADLTYSFYDQRGLRSTSREEVNPNHNEVEHYSCAGTQLVETGDNGYHSTWVRTADYGVYG